MEQVLSDLPLTDIFLANLLVGLIGAFFILGAPVAFRFRRSKLFLSLFWINTVIYYGGRAAIDLATEWRSSRIDDYLRSLHHPLSAPDISWLFLVILVDLSIIFLTLGYGSYFFRKQRSFLYFAAFITGLFLAAWVIAFFLRHNVASSLLSVGAILWIGWSCRTKSISSSVIWITFALLHVPIGLGSGIITPGLIHKIFVLLLFSKLSLIVAMYNMLEVRSKTKM